MDKNNLGELILSMDSEDVLQPGERFVVNIRFKNYIESHYVASEMLGVIRGMADTTMHGHNIVRVVITGVVGLDLITVHHHPATDDHSVVPWTGGTVLDHRDAGRILTSPVRGVAAGHNLRVQWSIEEAVVVMSAEDPKKRDVHWFISEWHHAIKVRAMDRALIRHPAIVVIIRGQD